MISLIVAKAENNVIGSNNDLPWYLPADLRRFKELTTGHTVVMGRKTFESILARLGTPLPNRRNVLLTRNPATAPEGVDVIHDIDSVRRLEGTVFVIGGAEVYRQLFPYVEKLYVTEVKAQIDGDVYFPAINLREWREVSRESHKKDEKNQYDFDFVVYDRISSMC